MRDAIIMTRMMELEDEDVQDSGGEWSKERCKEMCELMDVEKNKKKSDAMRRQMEGGEDKESKMSKVKDGLMKLKLTK